MNPADVSGILAGLGQLLTALADIRDLIDPRAWLLNAFRGSGAGAVLHSFDQFLFSTAAVGGPGPAAFVDSPPIKLYEPLARAAALASLAALLTWSGFRLMWSHSIRPHYSAHLLLPRLVLAVVLAAFATKFFQAAVEVNNVLCQTVLAGAGQRELTGFLGQLMDPAADLRSGPGLTVLTTAALLLGYLILALAYVIRYALLVLLAVTAPLAAVCFVLPETHRYAREWASLFVATLLMQPMQLLILGIAFSLENAGVSPVRHAFALAALFLSFKVPGALHSASSFGGRAATMAHTHAGHLLKALEKGTAAA